MKGYKFVKDYFEKEVKYSLNPPCKVGLGLNVFNYFIGIIIFLIYDDLLLTFILAFGSFFIHLFLSIGRDVKFVKLRLEKLDEVNKFLNKNTSKKS